MGTRDQGAEVWFGELWTAGDATLTGAHDSEACQPQDNTKIVSELSPKTLTGSWKVPHAPAPKARFVRPALSSCSQASQMPLAQGHSPTLRLGNICYISDRKLSSFR